MDKLYHYCLSRCCCVDSFGCPEFAGSVVFHRCQHHCIFVLYFC